MPATETVRKMTDEERRLAEANIGLAGKAVRMCSHLLRNRDDEEDAFAVGCLGICRAAMNFDPTHERAFSTYAISMATGYIRNAFIGRGIVRIPKRAMSAHAPAAHVEAADIVRRPFASPLAMDRVSDPRPGPADLVVRREVLSAIDAVGGRQGKVLRMALEGESASSIGAAIGVGAKRAERVRAAAVATMRRKFSGEEMRPCWPRSQFAR